MIGTIERKPNRHERRFKTAWDRKAPYQAKLKRIQDNIDEGKKAHREAIKRRIEAKRKLKDVLKNS